MKRDYERLKVEHDLPKRAIQFTSTRRANSSPSSKPSKGRSQSGLCAGCMASAPLSVTRGGLVREVSEPSTTRR